MTGARLKSRLSTHFAVPLIVLIVAQCFVSFANADGESCSVAKLTDSCRFFKELKGDELLEFPDGQTVPACAMGTVANEKQKKLDEIEKGLHARIKDILSQAPAGEFDEGEVQQAMYGHRLIRELKREGNFEMDWPPLKKWKETKPQVVNAAKVRDFMAKRVGEDGVRGLIAAGDAIETLSSYRLDQRIGKKVTYAIDDSQNRRVKALFEKSKSGVIEYVLRGRKESELSASEANILARVRSVTLREKYRADSTDCGPAHTAFFDYADDVWEVGIPPSMLFQPDESLMRSMIHEISHSFDSCRLSEEFKVRGKTHDAVPPSESPFAGVHRCLLDRGGSFSNVARAATDPMTTDGVCNHGKHLEGFCDWTAGEVLAQMSRAGSLDVASAGPSLRPLDSSEKPIGRKIKVPAQWKPFLYQLDGACQESADEKGGNHPLWRDRFEQIMALNPELRKRLGCVASKDPGCRRELSGARGGSVGGATAK